MKKLLVMAAYLITTTACNFVVSASPGDGSKKCDGARPPKECATSTTASPTPTASTEPGTTASATPAPTPTPTATSDGATPTPTPTPTSTPTPAAITYSVTLPTHSYTIYGSHEANKRTASFTHNATTAECSHDNGATYGACDSSSTLVFTIPDYNNTAILKIRFSNPDGGSSVYSYTPKTAHSGLTFHNCDRTFTTDTNYSTFMGLLSSGASSSAPYVVCINSGVTINASGGNYAEVTQTNIVIIGTDTPPTLNSVKLNEDTTTSVQKLIKLTIGTAGGIGDVVLGGRSQKYLIKSTVTQPVGNTIAPIYFLTGTTNAKAYITDSTIIQNDTGGGSAIFADSNYNDLTITGSTISNKSMWDNTIYWHGFGDILSVTNSTITNTGLYYGNVQLHQNAAATFDGVKFRTSNGAITVVVNSTISLKNNIFVHLDAGDNSSGASDAVLYSSSTGNVVTNSSTASGSVGAVGTNNIACNENGASANRFNRYFYNGGAISGTYATTPLVNGQNGNDTTNTGINNCSTYGITP